MRSRLGWLALFFALVAYYALSPWPMGGLPRLVSQTLITIQCGGNDFLSLCGINHVFTTLIAASFVASSATWTVLFLLAHSMRAGQHSSIVHTPKPIITVKGDSRAKED